VTFGSAVGVLGTLLFVLGLLAVAMRLLRKVATGAATGRGRLPFEVVQRIALGPKQGIAVVRIGSRVVAVSVGDGGVRPLLELDGEDEQQLLTEPPQQAAVGARPRGASAPAAAYAGAGGRDFLSALREAVRTAVPLVALAAALVLPASAQAQRAAGNAAGLPTGVVTRPAAPPPGAATPGLTAPQAAAPAQPVVGRDAMAVARVDTMMTRLAPQMDLRVGQAGEGGLRLSGTVGVVVMMGLLTLLPTLLLMMTGFTRILIVLHFLKQALGTQSAPPSHLVAGLALLLTAFVMAPTLSEVNRTALEPWMDGRMEQAEMMATGVKPFREFMLRQTRDSDLQTFIDMSEGVQPATEDDVSLVVLVSAFVTSELRTAFQIGFALFLPFIVIDVVVSSVLMSMGMFMLPPAMISLPFKLLLFVLVDGWALVVQGLVASFG
jgi:flagellar biosynthetic protein FliP